MKPKNAKYLLESVGLDITPEWVRHTVYDDYISLHYTLEGKLHAVEIPHPRDIKRAIKGRDVQELYYDESTFTLDYLQYKRNKSRWKGHYEVIPHPNEISTEDLTETVISTIEGTYSTADSYQVYDSRNTQPMREWIEGEPLPDSSYTIQRIDSVVDVLDLTEEERSRLEGLGEEEPFISLAEARVREQLNNEAERIAFPGLHGDYTDTMPNGVEVTFSSPSFQPTSEYRGKLRSKTYVGIAKAMAKQWTL